jgi:hypothetical protein
MPTEYESNITMTKLSNGDYDLVSSLYSTEDLVDYGGNTDSDNVLTDLSDPV